MEHELDDFFEKEHKANSVRKKPLDKLPYIIVPEEFLSITLTGNKYEDAISMLKHLSTQKIVNFTGISNTDLKLEYGTANITVLTEYDLNYTQLVRSLQTIAEGLVAEDKKSLAKQVLEFAISTHSDISASYKLLADLYIEENEIDKVNSLIAEAKDINSSMSASIIKALEEKLLNYSKSQTDENNN